MDKGYKPSGYNSVSPYLVVNGAQQLIDLLKKVFDAKEMRRFDLPGGKIMHAEIRIDDSIIMIADSSDQYPPVQVWLHVYVPEVDEVFRKAILQGCEVVQQPMQREGDPNRRGTFRDFAGNHWSAGTEL